MNDRPGPFSPYSRCSRAFAFTIVLRTIFRFFPFFFLCHPVQQASVSILSHLHACWVLLCVVLAVVVAIRGVRPQLSIHSVYIRIFFSFLPSCAKMFTTTPGRRCCRLSKFNDVLSPLVYTHTLLDHLSHSSGVLVVVNFVSLCNFLYFVSTVRLRTKSERTFLSGSILFLSFYPFPCYLRFSLLW